MKKLTFFLYLSLLFFTSGYVNAIGVDEDGNLVRINKNGREICVDSNYLMLGEFSLSSNVKTATSKTRSESLPDSAFANQDITLYADNGCTGKTLTFPMSHAEEKCTYCWHSCYKFFDDGSSAHTYINSIQVPEGVVALAFTECGADGSNDQFSRVLEPGCNNIGDDYIVDFTFATETDTPGRYEPIGTPNIENGRFDNELSVTHYYYGPDGIKNAQGGSWYQYIFELLDPTQPRKRFQVGIGGTWLEPTQTEWKPGDPCRCDPRGEDADGDLDCVEEDLTKCTNGCCGVDGCGSSQTMEGGAGYWNGKLPTSRVKWTIGSSSKCYTYWSNSPLEVANSNDLECDSLGVIAVSNRLLYPPDGIGFVDDGMLGHAWINTPIGKIRNNDKKRSLTLILDAKNFKGPVAYMLPEYYGSQSKWTDQNGEEHPKETFTNVGMNTGGGAYEWNDVPIVGHTNNDKTRDIRIHKMQFSFNEEGEKTIMMSAGKSWTGKADLYNPLERIMKNWKAKLNESLLLANDKGITHPCQGLDSEWKLSFEGKTFKIASIKHRTENDGVCSAVVEWDVNSNDALNCNSTHCNIKEAFKVSEKSITKEDDGQWTYDGGRLEGYDNIPTDLQGDDVLQEHEFTLNYDRRSESLCGAYPVEPTLFCRQTSTEDWIGWKWFHYQNQPGLARLKLNKKRRKYLRKRIKRLHLAMAKNSPLNEWLKAPSSMPDLVTIDPKLIVDPPNKYKIGFVPIVVYQGMEKPEGCLVT